MLFHFGVPGTCILHCRARYDFFLASPLLGATTYETEFDWGGTRIYVSTCIVEGLRCFFIEPANGFFAVGSVYGRKDDEMRFDFFCKVGRQCPPPLPERGMGGSRLGRSCRCIQGLGNPVNGCQIGTKYPILHVR
jgi:hypothetical protein